MTKRNDFLRTLGINIGFVLLGLLSAVLVVELALGGWLRAGYAGRVRIPRNVDVTRDVSKYFGSGKKIHYSRDQYGFRGDYGGDVSKIDILTIGGSTTDQINIDDTKTWQAQISQLFARDGKMVRIANAGIDGQSTFGHVENFEKWFPSVPGLRPKYILIYAGVNDFYRTETDEPENQWALTRILEQKSVLFGLYETFAGWFRVYYGCPLLGHRVVNYAGRRWTDRAVSYDYTRVAGKRVRYFGDRLRLLQSLAAKLGAKTIFVTQRFSVYEDRAGSIYGIDEDFRYPGMKSNGVDVRNLMSFYNGTLLNICMETQSVCIDLAREIDLKLSDYYDYVHPNESGTEKVAKYLHQKLTSIQDL